MTIFRKSAQKIQVSLKSDKNNRYFAWRRMLIYENEKHTRQRLYRTSKHTFCVQ